MESLLLNSLNLDWIALLLPAIGIIERSYKCLDIKKNLTMIGVVVVHLY